MGHCDDNRRDRAKGDVAEQQAFELIRSEGLIATRHPHGVTGPDIIVFHRDRQYIVEVRAKYPDRYGRYGLEQPKYEEWLERDVIYLIKDTRDERWVWARVRDLPTPERGRSGSYAKDGSGRADRNRANDYWPAYCWTPLCWRYAA